MLVTLKTLRHDSFTVEIDPSETVKSFKEKIETEKGEEYPAKSMKLMYAGKILVDSQRVCDYNIEEKKFVIVLVKKAKIALVSECEEVLEDTDGPMSVSPHDIPREATIISSRSGSDQGITTDVMHEQMVRQIIDMGYSRDDVERALHASFNHPDRAVEYLVTGIFPSSASSNESESEDNRSNIVNSQNHQGIELGSAALYSQARLNAAAGLNGDIVHGNPQSHTLVMPNQESVYQLLNERLDENQQAAAVAANLRTPQDHEAIERLKQLGFPEYQATEAYFACERNENSAADFLFSQNYD